MKENNILIAEFMGYINNGDDEFLIHPVTNHDVNDFPYDTSWDWLIPVVEKIEQINEGVPQQMLHVNLYSEIGEVYTAVVNFIKAYNYER